MRELSGPRPSFRVVGSAVSATGGSPVTGHPLTGLRLHSNCSIFVCSELFRWLGITRPIPRI